MNKITTYNPLYYQENKERLIANQIRYHQRKKEAYNKRMREWWKKNKKRVNKEKRERYKNDIEYREKIKKISKEEYHKKNKEII